MRNISKNKKTNPYQKTKQIILFCATLLLLN